METIQIVVYDYNELSDIAKERAIRNLVYKYWGEGEIYEHIKDACYLLDIPEKDKTFKIDNPDNILFGNTRGNLYYTISSDGEEFYLNCTDCITVNDFDAFYKWLGLNKSVIKQINKGEIDVFINNAWKKTTTLHFGHDIELTESQNNNIIKAKAKFDAHIRSIWEQINEQYEYMQTEKYFIDNDLFNDYKFYSNGKIFKQID